MDLLLHSSSQDVPILQSTTHHQPSTCRTSCDMIKLCRANDAYKRLLLGKVQDMSNDYKHKPDQGTLFKNTFKKNDSHPDYTGTYTTHDGVTREFAAWFNEEKGYFRVRFSDQYQSAKRA